MALSKEKTINPNETERESGGIPPRQAQPGDIPNPNSSKEHEIVILVSAPLLKEDKETPVEGLGIEKEIEAIVETLEKIRLPILLKIVVEVATRSKLHEILSRKEKPLILHYIGHGAVSQEGIALVLEDEEGIADLFSAEKLEILLEGKAEPPCQLVLLNACHSEGLAAGFERARVPHILVIKAEDKILDLAARSFAETFYRMILEGQKILDAFIDGQRAIFINKELGKIVNWKTHKRDINIREYFKFNILPKTSNHNEPLELEGGISGGLIKPDWPKSNLPSDNLKFIGRRKDLHELVVKINDNNRCIAIHGMGGMGKTSLAIALGRWQHERKRWRDGVWLIELREVENVATVRIKIIEELELATFNEEAQIRTNAELVKHLKNRKSLLILDDLDNLLEKEEEQKELIDLLSRLQRSENLKILVTSRQTLSMEIDHEPFTIEELKESDAIEVFRKYATPQEEWGENNNLAQDFREVIKFLDGYPMALKLAGSYLKVARRTLSQLKEDLHKAMEKGDRKPNRETSLRISLDLSYNVLPPEARQTFLVLGIFPSGINKKMSEFLMGDNAVYNLEILWQYSMTEIKGLGNQRRFKLPEPVREYANRKQTPREPMGEYAPIVLDYYWTNILQIAKNQQDLEEERANLNKFLDWGRMNEESEDRICRSARIVIGLEDKLELLTPNQKPIDILSHFLETANKNKDIYAEAEIYRCLAMKKLKELGIEVARRDYDQAIDKYRKYDSSLSDEREKAEVNVKIGNCQEITEELEQALESYEKAWQFYQKRNEQKKIEETEKLISRVKAKIEFNNLDLKCFSFETLTVNEQGNVIKTESKNTGYFVEEIGEGITIEMVAIPGGTFMMGAPEDEKDSQDWEKPQHEVNIPAFYMSQTLITQAQWRVVASLPPVEKMLEVAPSYFTGDNLPVERVSWRDAIEFCARLTRHTDKNYRLPSEAEWEYAARAGTETPFHFGKTITSNLANYDARDIYREENAGVYRQETTPVKKFTPNAFGLYDIHGNLWEWCLDPWNDNYEGAPKDGSVWDKRSKNDNRYQNILENIKILMQDTSNHVLRGGSWVDLPGICRSASRNHLVDDYNDVGFRVVCPPS